MNTSEMSLHRSSVIKSKQVYIGPCNKNITTRCHPVLDVDFLVYYFVCIFEMRINAFSRWYVIIDSIYNLVSDFITEAVVNRIPGNTCQCIWSGNALDAKHITIQYFKSGPKFPGIINFNNRSMLLMSLICCLITADVKHSLQSNDLSSHCHEICYMTVPHIAVKLKR